MHVYYPAGMLYHAGQWFIYLSLFFVDIFSMMKKQIIWYQEVCLCVIDVITIMVFTITIIFEWTVLM